MSGRHSARGPAAGPAPVALDVPRDAAGLAPLRAAVHDFAVAAGFPRAVADEVTLAAGEACANAIAHAAPGAGGGRLALRLECVGDELRITIADFCRTDDICRVRSRDLADVRPGGIGVHCMEQLMDHVEFAGDAQGWAALRLVRRRAPGEGR